MKCYKCSKTESSEDSFIQFSSEKWLCFECIEKASDYILAKSEFDKMLIFFKEFDIGCKFKLDRTYIEVFGFDENQNYKTFRFCFEKGKFMRGNLK